MKKPLRPKRATAAAKPSAPRRAVRKKRITPAAEHPTAPSTAKKAAVPTTPTTPTTPRRRRPVAVPVTPRRTIRKLAPPKLPEAYGTGRLFLVARDPRWLYAHWDFTREQQQQFLRLATAGHLILRIFENSFSGKRVAQVDLPAAARHWFVPGGRGDTRYVAELGYRRAGRWVRVAQSNAVTTPPETITPDTSFITATIPIEAPIVKVLETIATPAADHQPPAEVRLAAAPVLAVPRLETAGPAPLPAPTPLPPTRQWPAALPQSPARAPAQASVPRQAPVRTPDPAAGQQAIRLRIMNELATLSAAHILPETRPAAADVPAPTSDEWQRPGRAFRPLTAPWPGLPVPPSSPTGGWSGDLI